MQHNYTYRRICRMVLSSLFAGCLAMLQFPLTAFADASLGDLNGDGSVDASDASLILIDSATMGTTGSHQLSDAQLALSDIDGDGQTDATDASIILQYSAAYGIGTTLSLAEYWKSQNADPTVLDRPAMMVSTKNLAVSVNWTPDTTVDGYEIYRASYSTGEYTKIATVTEKGKGSYTDPMESNDASYFYKIRSYRIWNGQTYYSAFSGIAQSGTNLSILYAATLKERTGFPVYNRQGTEAETTSYSCTLSEHDKALLEAFAKENFPADATREDKLWITLQWIHYNVNYADTSAEWESIAGLSFTEAIFEKQTGQCAQYNGAMASMMAYLGYDVSLVQGYRGTYPDSYWQHFWVEIDLGGRLYIMECGNEGSDGDWWYFLTPYEHTRRYIRNQVNM